MLAEFIGKPTVLYDKAHEPYELMPGSICNVEITSCVPHGGDRWTWTAIETQDGHVLACPYSSLDGIYRNWRRATAD